MPPIDALRGEKLLVQIGDGSLPTELFTHDCLINAERGIQFSSDTTDDTLPDCADPSAPGWKETQKDGLVATITGGGKLHTSSIAFWSEWFESGDSRSLRVRIVAPEAKGGGFWAGAFDLTAFEVTGNRKEYATASVTLVSSGRVAWASDEVVLQSLTLSSDLLYEGSEAGTIIGLLEGRTPGSSLSIVPVDERVAVDASGNLVAGSVAAEIAAISVSVREFLLEAVNSPLVSQLSVRSVGFRLSGISIDDDAAAGTIVGGLSIAGLGAGPWVYSLADDAGGMFALTGDNIVVGLAALDHDANPSPSIVVSATDGNRTINRTFVMNVRRPLPALPMATGTKVVGLGHSFIQRSGWGILSSGKPRDLSVSNVRGVLPWIRLRDNRFNLDVWHDLTNNLGTDNYLTGAFQGVGGDHIVAEGSAPGVIARLPYVASLRPGIVYLDIATNDISSAPNVSVALVVGRLDALLTLLRNKGIWTVIQTVTDRGAWPQGDDRATIVAGVNEWIKAQATRDGVRVADCTELGFNHPTFDVSLFGGDVLHPNPKGGARMAGAVLPILQEMVAAGDHMNLSDASIFGASNLWADAAGATTAASTATGTSGTRISTLVIARSSGDSTVVASVEEAGTYNKQVATWTMSGTETGNRYEEWRLRKNGATVTLASLGIVPGVDWLEAGCYVELSPWDGWLAVQLQLEFYDASNAQAYIARGGLSNPDRATQDMPFAASGFSGWLTIPPFLIPGDVGAINWTAATRPLVIEVNRRVAGPGGTLKFSKPFLRKAVDPRPTWNIAT